MGCINGVPTEVKARRIVQCPEDDAMRVYVEGTDVTEYDHTILCEVGEGGVQTGIKVLVVTTFSQEGVPTISYFDLSTGLPWVANETTLAACPTEEVQVDVEIQEMCEAGVTTFLRWFVIQDGVPTGTTYDTAIDGTSYTPTGIVASGKCVVENAAQIPDGYSVVGITQQSAPTGFPELVESITVTALVGTVIATTDSGTITVPEGGSYSWGSGTYELIDVSTITFTGSNELSEYTLHWEAVALAV